MAINSYGPMNLVQTARLGPANWRFEKGFVRNQELQWYQEENAWCENGLLIIEAEKKQDTTPIIPPAAMTGKGTGKILPTGPPALIHLVNIPGSMVVL